MSSNGSTKSPNVFHRPQNQQHISISSQTSDLEPKTPFDEAVKTLFSLVSNQDSIELWKKARRENKNINLNEVMFKHLNTLKVDIGGMNCIHITGTKGKGSTASFIERILSNYGFKTGLYTSPHLVDVRERIKINGKLLDKNSFANYFWLCYNRLLETQNGGETGHPNLPPFFQFLTLMAFLVFQQEKVDVAVIEVGIGGRSDSTNVVKPQVSAVTSIGYDHMEVLGDTLTDIALEKSGIFKPGVPAVSAKQSEEVLSVLRGRAHELGIPLIEVSELDNYLGLHGAQIELGLEGRFQHSNAAVAIESARIWLAMYLRHQQQSPIQSNPPFNPTSSVPISLFQNQETFFRIPHYGDSSQAEKEQLPLEFLKGLKETRWPGRAQTVHFNERIEYCLDGAHTPESLRAAVEWFSSKQPEQSGSEAHPGDKMILIFNCKQNKDSVRLLQTIVDLFSEFDEVIFTTNHISQTQQCDLSRPESHLQIWNAALKAKEDSTHTSNAAPTKHSINQKHHIFSCVTSCVSYVENLMKTRSSSITSPSTSPVFAEQDKSPKCRVLVTGSLYLVGAFLEYFNGVGRGFDQELR